MDHLLSALGSAPVQHMRFTEPADLLAAMPGIVLEVTPLPQSDFFVDQTTVRLGDVVLIHGRCSPMVIVARPGPATIALQFPLENADTLILNGRALPAFGFCLYGQNSELVRSNVKDTIYAVLVMPPEVAETMLVADDGRHAVGAGECTMRTARPDDWSRMAEVIRAAATISHTAPEVFATEPPRLALRAALLGLAAELVHNADDVSRAGRSVSPEAWSRTVLGAEAYLKSHVERPIYTQELCKVLGVSPATLGDAFHRTIGMSPHRYLKLRRLNMVRTVLLQERGSALLVKCVALDHGFWHLGEFAREYREQFGETPSQTLAAAKPCTSPGTAANDHRAEEGENPASMPQRSGRTR